MGIFPLWDISPFFYLEKFMTTKNVYDLVYDNDATQLSARLMDFLSFLGFPDEEIGNISRNDIFPSEEELHAQVINQKDSKDKLPTRFNKYFINHVKKLLIDIIQPEYKWVLERMLVVDQYLLDDSSKDDCLFSFMQFSAKGTNLDDMVVLFVAIRQYSEKFLLEKFKSNLTYSFPVTALLIDELTDKTERYLHHITDLNHLAVQPECYLLRLGDFGRDTFNLYGDKRVNSINQILIKHISNYEMIAAQNPDYLMLNIIET